MKAALERIAVALGGAIGASFVVALVEARSCASLGMRGAEMPALLSHEIGVLAPLAAAVGLFFALFDLFLFPDAPRSIRQHIAKLREEPILLRSRTAAVAPLGVITIAAWMIASAQLARSILSDGGAAEAGIELSLASLATLAAISACTLAVLRPLRRALAAGAEKYPRMLDPVTTGAIALVVVLAVFFYGVQAGDAGGAGGGMLGIFGVLKRRELDLRPVVDLLAVLVGAYAALVAFARPRASRVGVVLSLGVAIVALFWTTHEAHAMNADPAGAQAVERGAPLGKIALAVLRKATDRDHDGASPFFGGGDCDDRNPKRNPNAIDVPGNGIDEDCAGGDLAIPAPVTPPRPSVKAEDRLEGDLNLVLVTIDTLRLDEGFMGYDLPTTPNMDALAKDSVVFERAYAMASYTGKSLAPLLIGKYPSETNRNNSHFTTYAASNTFITERLKKAGFRTFGAASHWYFNPWSGLTQGMDEFDLSAKPASGQGDTDSSVTGVALTEAALKLLSKPENTQSGRFFMWIHYFDPHGQYAPHEDAPSFARPGSTSANAESRAAYDAEVWFTDKNLGRVLDAIKAAPWGKKTAIVITSDHGEAFNDHGMSNHGGELWESLVRVPLLIYVPGVKPHRIPVKRSHIDVVPTLLDLMRLPAPDDGELSGQTMIGDVLDDARELDGGEPQYPERDVYLDMPVGPYTGMRRGIIFGPTPGTKLIHFGASNYSLFDLAVDPAEATDLAGDKERFGPVFSAFQSKRGSLHEVEATEDKSALP